MRLFPPHCRTAWRSNLTRKLWNCPTRIDADAARRLLPQVQASEEVIETLCVTAAALGIASLRAPLLAVRAARAAAALAGRREVLMEDAALAARAWCWRRARRASRTRGIAAGRADRPRQMRRPSPIPKPAARSPIRCSRPLWRRCPPGLLAKLAGAQDRGRARPGRSGAATRAGARGRPAGTRPGDPRSGLRLNLVETLRAAAPWQGVRGGDGARSGSAATTSG